MNNFNIGWFFMLAAYTVNLFLDFKIKNTILGIILNIFVFLFFYGLGIFICEKVKE